MLLPGCPSRSDSAVADEDQPPAARQVGPTITGIWHAGPDHVVEDLAIPGALRPVFEEGFALAATLDALARANPGPHEERADFDDPFAVRPSVTERQLPLAIVGRDSGTGRLVRRDGFEEPGGLQVDWPGLRDEPAIARRHEALERRLRTQGARLLRNPLWQLLPPEMAFLTNDARGPMLSVHPLGGCAMGDRGSDGVVDAIGRVFSGDGDAVRTHYERMLPLLMMQAVFRWRLTKEVLHRRGLIADAFTRAPGPELDEGDQRELDRILARIDDWTGIGVVQG